MENGYKTITIDGAIEKSRQIPRSFALQKVQLKKEADFLIRAKVPRTHQERQLKGE